MRDRIDDAGVDAVIPHCVNSSLMRGRKHAFAQRSNVLLEASNREARDL